MIALKTFARNMRAAPTDAEVIVWRQLRAHRFAGHKFKRQQPIGSYIADFVCFEAKLIVEVDSGQHNDSAADKLRDGWLRSQGFAVLRFWNNEVSQNLEGVLTRILETLTPSPSVLAGRAARCIGQPFRRGGTCASKPRLLPPPPEGREAVRLGAVPANERLSYLSPRGRGTEGEGET